MVRHTKHSVTPIKAVNLNTRAFVIDKTTSKVPCRVSIDVHKKKIDFVSS